MWGLLSIRLMFQFVLSRTLSFFFLIIEWDEKIYPENEKWSYIRSHRIDSDFLSGVKSYFNLLDILERYIDLFTFSCSKNCTNYKIPYVAHQYQRLNTLLHVFCFDCTRAPFTLVISHFISDTQIPWRSVKLGFWKYIRNKIWRAWSQICIKPNTYIFLTKFTKLNVPYFYYGIKKCCFRNLLDVLLPRWTYMFSIKFRKGEMSKL